MIIYREQEVVLNFDDYGLNLGVLNFDDYRGATEKLIKTESNMFDDNYVYHTNSYQGYSSQIDIVVKDSISKTVISAFYKGNRISLPREQGKCRKYYVDGEIKTSYHRNGYLKVSIPIYFNAFIYSIEEYSTTNIQKGRIFEILNKGDIYSEPTVTIRGRGTVIFEINGERHILDNSTDGYKIVSSSKEQNVYDLNGKIKNITSAYSGVFPILNVGSNTVQLIAGNSMDIEYFWRWRQ